jgi:hypothetical protein
MQKNRKNEKNIGDELEADPDPMLPGTAPVLPGLEPWWSLGRRRGGARAGRGWLRRLVVVDGVGELGDGARCRGRGEEEAAAGYGRGGGGRPGRGGSWVGG